MPSDIILSSSCIFFGLQQLIILFQKGLRKKRGCITDAKWDSLYYNVTGGPFSRDPSPVFVNKTQMIWAYGSGFFMGGFFPYYFYKSYDMRSSGGKLTNGVCYSWILPFFPIFLHTLSLVKWLTQGTLGRGLHSSCMLFSCSYKPRFQPVKNFEIIKNSLEAIP